jgi:hypothetical protein
MGCNLQGETGNQLILSDEKMKGILLYNKTKNATLGVAFSPVFSI